MGKLGALREPMITEQQYQRFMKERTKGRGGIDALGDQLWAEASRHGLGRAADVLIVADGAAWIWNLADDRFPQARQRLDAYHAKQHLWAVADALHGAGTPAARAWVTPLLELPTLDPARQDLLQREINPSSAV